MTGPIIDMAVVVCRDCGAFYILDERMYEDPDLCLTCGGELGGASAETWEPGPGYAIYRFRAGMSAAGERLTWWLND